MLLRTQIFLVFLSILIVSIGVTSLFHYQTSRKAQLQEVYNHLESVSEAKKLRMQGIIMKRQEKMGLLQIKEQLRENFARYLQTKDPKTQQTLLTSLQIIKNKLPSFKELHLVSMEGRVMVSTSPQQIDANFAGKESFRHALSGEVCVHEFFYEKDKSLNINLSGVLTLGDRNIGVIIVQTSAGDILSIINDYTGLGESGETTLARRIDDKVIYLTPTRFFPKPGDSLVRAYEPNKAMSLALRGVEKLLPQSLDYRGKQVVAAPRFLPDVGWGLTTKIDREEVMAPIRASLRRTLLLALLLIGLVAVAAHFFARHLVRPIVSLGEASQEIANGKLDRRIAYNSKNELGQLASNFNRMANKLVETNLALAQKVQELDRSNESLKRFAYVISHDLKSPLHSIAGLVDNMQESVDSCDDPDIRMMLGMVDESARHMQTLISGILQYSTSGITSDEQEPLNLDLLIQEIIPHLQVPAHIKITVDSLPVIRAERILMVQVFQNLIGNAIKFMDKPQGRVKVGGRQEDDLFKFWVSDNGRGIKKKYLEKIFELFNKTHDLPGVDSSGLGLSIVKKIVESKGGRIWVESEEGIGSTFFFTLPQQHVGL